MNIHAIPAYSDNYIWVIEDHGKAIIVDPGDADPVFHFLEERQCVPVALLITHHHWDHITGIDALRSQFDIPIYGPLSSKIPQVTHPLSEGDQLSLLNSNVNFHIMEVPGHTQDHIAYYAQIDDTPVLFCGDTLFAAGCGRLFDGSYSQFTQSLKRINALPNETRIYCTHEYTLANLAFAQTVEPDNQDITARLKIEQENGNGA